VGADVALDEGVVVFEVAQAGLGHGRAPEGGGGRVAVAVPRGPEPGGAADGGRPWGPACAGTAQAIHCGGAPLSFCLRVWKRADVDRVLRAPSAPVPAVPVGLSRVFAASGGIGPER